MSVADRMRRSSSDGELDLPLPGSGHTWERFTRLAAIARADTVAGRLAEAHTDALATLAELHGPAPKPGQVWGVWAAEPPRPVLRAVPAGDGYRLEGRKAWCSGASICDRALVTARVGDDRALFAVDLTEPTVHPVPDTWHAVGMAESDSGSVDFDSTPAETVGAPGEYLTRAGFWHGAVGVAACWYGAACGVADPLLRKARSGKADSHIAAHLGAVAAALLGARESLRHAAVEIDADPLDRSGCSRIRARRVRAVVEHVATEVLDRVGRALGAAPLCDDAAHAHRVADLTVYLRQSHAERDLADLGRDLAEAEDTDGEPW